MTAQKHTSKLILIALFIISLSFQSNAQVFEIVDHIKRASIARDHIRQLHDGTLIIRLRSKSNNIEAMKKALASDKLSSKRRKRLTKQLDKLISETEKENRKIIHAVTKHYTFSDYRIVRDTSIHQLFEKKEKGYFINSEHEVDPELSLDFSKPVYILKYGPTKKSDNSRQEGLIITDFENNELESPFPYLTKTMWPFFAPFSFFVGKDNVSPQFIRMIQSTNESLNNFYIRSEIKREKDKLKKQIKDLKDD